jgi:hypothetical protein
MSVVSFGLSWLLPFVLDRQLLEGIKNALRVISSDAFVYFF